MAKSKAYATQLLDRLIELDNVITGAYYEMGRLLSAIKHGKLWETLGYESMAHLIEEELTCSTAAGNGYINMYRRFQKLGYTQAESLDLINEFGVTRMQDYLRGAKTKVSKRAIKRAIDEWRRNHQQVNFTVDAEGSRILERVLSEYGAERTDSGIWMGTHEAFRQMLEQLDPGTRKKAA